MSVKEDMEIMPEAFAEPSTCPCSWGCSNSPRVAVDITVKAALICLLLAGLEPAHQKESLSQPHATLP